MYRTGDAIFLINADGSGRKRQLEALHLDANRRRCVDSRQAETSHLPATCRRNPKELVTLREHTPEDGSDRLLAKTSQFISASSNADASVFAGASRSKSSPYVLILLRAAHREMTLCEHAASDPAMVHPLFTPDSQSVLFVSDRHGKPAIYMMPVGKFVEETAAEDK